MGLSLKELKQELEQKFSGALEDANGGVFDSLGERLNSIESKNMGARANQAWIATEGQRTFTLTDSKYTPNTGSIDVYVGAAKQVTGLNYTEDSTTAFTLSEGVPEGTIVEAIWTEPSGVIEANKQLILQSDGNRNYSITTDEDGNLLTTEIFGNETLFAEKFIVIKSNSGARFQLSVNDRGNLITTKI